MKIGLIGLGKMGLNLALNMKDHNHEVVAYEISEQACKMASDAGIKCYNKVKNFIDQNMIKTL